MRNISCLLIMAVIFTCAFAVQAENLGIKVHSVSPTDSETIKAEEKEAAEIAQHEKDLNTLNEKISRMKPIMISQNRIFIFFILCLHQSIACYQAIPIINHGNKVFRA